MLMAGGHLWRGMERWCGNALRWPQSYQAMLIYAPHAEGAEGADLLEPSAWKMTEAVQFSGQVARECNKAGLCGTS